MGGGRDLDWRGRELSRTGLCKVLLTFGSKVLKVLGSEYHCLWLFSSSSSYRSSSCSRIGARNGSKCSKRSSSVTRTSQSRRNNNCRSIRLTSARANPNPSYVFTLVYLAQCLFFGLESFKFFAARIREARKMRCTVHRIPFATGGRRDRSRAKYTSDVIKVGTWTRDLSTRDWMNASREGKGGWLTSGSEYDRGGVEGGVRGIPLEFGWGTGSSHRITNDACLARYLIICLSTRCITNSSSAALFWALK